MKKLVNIFALFCLIACKAQSPVKPLYMKGGDNISGAYYKDLDNDLNKFEGTWLYSNGSTVLTIVLKKKVMVLNQQRNIYIDYLVGEYKYVENGLEKVNTMPNINTEYEDIDEHNIVGYAIINNSAAPVCNDCDSSERRVSLQFSDPTRPGVEKGLSGKVTIKRFDIGSTQKIKIFLKQTGSHIPDVGDTVIYNSFNIPWGEYTLTKIN